MKSFLDELSAPALRIAPVGTLSTASPLPDLRELARALEACQASLDVVALQLARVSAGQLLTTAGHHAALVETVMAAVALEFEIPVRDLQSRSRPADVCEARQAAWWLLMRVFGWSSTRTARAFGRHHGAILNGVHRIEDLIHAGDKPVTAHLTHLRAALTSDLRPLISSAQ